MKATLPGLGNRVSVLNFIAGDDLVSRLSLTSAFEFVDHVKRLKPAWAPLMQEDKASYKSRMKTLWAPNQRGHYLEQKRVSKVAQFNEAKKRLSGTSSTTFLVDEQDENEQVNNNTAARNHEALVARDIATELASHGPSPLYDQRFARIEDIDPATSADIADELRLNNHIDTQGFLLQDGNDIGASIMNSPSDYPVIDGLRPRIKTREVINQLRVMRSNHRMYDDYARRTLTFIQAHTP